MSANNYFIIIQFENSILGICNRINATENIRGINYRFSKNGSDLSDVHKQINISSNSHMKAVYVRSFISLLII